MTTAPASSPPTSAERMLDAAARLVVDRGAAHLTLDAVAAAAGVSKGGLLYHFPSKSALLEAMVLRHLKDVEDRAASHARVAWDGAGEPPLTYHVAGRVRALIEKNCTQRAMGAALLAASVGDSALLDPLREKRRECCADFARLPLPFTQAAILNLAVDGLLLTELLHLSTYTVEERAQIVEAILAQMTGGDAK